MTTAQIQSYATLTGKTYAEAEVLVNGTANCQDLLVAFLGAVTLLLDCEANHTGSGGGN